MIFRTLPALIVLAGCGYEPPLRPKDDPRIRAVPNNIEGAISLIGPEEPSQTIILLFDDANPGPPVGTSGPIDFSTVGADEYAYAGDGLTSVLDDTGLVEMPLSLGWHAGWAATELPDGAYQVEAIVDMDGDFSPGAFTLGGATCGDWQGHYERTPGSGVKGAVAVEGGMLLRGVPITVDTLLDTERPAFVFPGDDGYKTISLAAAGANPAAPLTYTLQSSGVHVQYSDKESDRLDLGNVCAPGPDPRFCAPETTCEGAFSVLTRDADGNGVMDPHPDYPPEFGLKDIWPRVLLEYLGTVTFDANGKVVRDPETGFPIVTPPDLPEGVFWAGENFPFGLEAAFGLAVTPLNEPTKMPAITVMYPPLVAKFFPEWVPECGGEPPEDLTEGCSQLFDLSLPEDRAQVPKGVWGVNVVSHTGQTWGLPNEISEWGVVSTDPAFDPKSQGGFLLTRE